LVSDVEASLWVSASVAHAGAPVETPADAYGTMINAGKVALGATPSMRNEG
jgi:hypothetical protein